MHKKMLAVLAAAACAGLAGCDNTAQGVKQDAKEDTAKAREEAAEAKAETADERAEAKQEGKEAAGDVKGAAQKAGDAIVGAKQTLDVKTALMADTTIDASHIDVDTDDATKTVTLKGTVPSAAQKASAEKVARAKAEGYKIRNLLTVAKS
jgi:hyperosmotically inducible protein